MAKIQEKKDKVANRKVRLLLIDDALSRNQVKHWVNQYRSPDIDLEIFEEADFNSALSRWEEMTPVDLVLVDISFASPKDDADKSLTIDLFDKISEQHRLHKTKLIIYSKYLPNTGSLVNLRDRADALCVGPDTKQNLTLAAKRAWETIFKGYTSHSTTFSKRWRTICELSDTKKKMVQFESLCGDLLSNIEGFSLKDRQHKWLDMETDLLVDNKNKSDFWIESLGNPILVDCKVAKNPLLVSTVYELIGRLTLARAKTAILFLTAHISPSVRGQISDIVKAASAEGKHILIVDAQGLEQIVNGDSPDTQLKMAYFSALSQHWLK